jgi:hypothetical protein
METMIFPIENGQFSIHDRFFQDLAGQPTVQEMLAAKETGGEDGDCCSKHSLDSSMDSWRITRYWTGYGTVNVGN